MDDVAVMNIARWVGTVAAIGGCKICECVRGIFSLAWNV